MSKEGVKQRISNVEGMYSIYFVKRLNEAKPPFVILRFALPWFGSAFRRRKVFYHLIFKRLDQPKTH
jgi:hypothetical protein